MTEPSRTSSPGDRVRSFIESGREGTVREIATASSVGLETAYACLKRMELEAEAVRLYQRELAGPGRPKADVWGRPPVAPPALNLSVTLAALASRTLLEIAWNEGIDP